MFWIMNIYLGFSFCILSKYRLYIATERLLNSSPWFAVWYAVNHNHHSSISLSSKIYYVCWNHFINFQYGQIRIRNSYQMIELQTNISFLSIEYNFWIWNSLFDKYFRVIRTWIRITTCYLIFVLNRICLSSKWINWARTVVEICFNQIRLKKENWVIDMILDTDA